MRNLLQDSYFEIAEDEVFRMMGYPHAASVSETILHICREQILRVRRLADPWGGYRQVRIEGIGGDWVRLDSGRTLSSRRVASILRRAESVSICLVTLGPAVGTDIHRLVAGGCAIEALALDAAASAATSALMGQLRERICAEAGKQNRGTTVPCGPGYTGWEIQDMPILFSCLAAENPPVRLNEQLMMTPEKSLISVVGIVPGGRRAAEVVPCRLCDLESCSVRRAPYRADAGG